MASTHRRVYPDGKCRSSATLTTHQLRLSPRAPPYRKSRAAVEDTSKYFTILKSRSGEMFAEFATSRLQWRVHTATGSISARIYHYVLYIWRNGAIKLEMKAILTFFACGCTRRQFGESGVLTMDTRMIAHVAISEDDCDFLFSYVYKFVHVRGPSLLPFVL